MPGWMLFVFLTKISFEIELVGHGYKNGLCGVYAGVNDVIIWVYITKEFVAIRVSFVERSVTIFNFIINFSHRKISKADRSWSEKATSCRSSGSVCVWTVLSANLRWYRMFFRYWHFQFFTNQTKETITQLVLKVRAECSKDCDSLLQLVSFSYTAHCTRVETRIYCRLWDKMSYGKFCVGILIANFFL